MKGISLKTIFIILVVVLLIIAIYNNFLKKDNETIVANEFQSSTSNNIVSTDIRIGIIEFDNMNPILSNNKNVQDISRLIFDPLFTITENYKLEGVLAKECSKISEKTYIIKLKENTTWKDGEKFDSSDVIFTIDMLKKIENSSVYYYNVKNITLLEAIDESTIKIEIDTETPYYEYNLTFPIISSKYFNEANFWEESLNLKPVGTGVFYISDVNNESIILKKNLKNENAKKIKLDSITLKKYDSLLSTINAFKTEEIDIFTTSNRNIEEYLGKTIYNKIEYINRDYYYLSLNCSNNVLANKEVRQAINSAINKEAIIKEVYNGKYKVSNFPLDFGSFVYDTNNTVMAYNTNTAKGLLVDNGWKYTSKKWRKTVNHRSLTIELDLLVNKENGNLVKVAKNIKEQLETTGIRINITEATQSQYNRRMNDNNYDILLSDSYYGYSPSLNRYFCTNNIANYENEEITNILNEIQNITDENELKQKYSRIMEIYNDEVPYISLYYNTNTLIYTKNMKGRVNPNSFNLFYGIEEWYREYNK